MPTTRLRGGQHQHLQGQLILALHGAVTCTAESGIWIVPPDSGLWVPGGVPHSNQVTSNARLSYLFVEPGAVALPNECCTLSVSPMLREIIHRLADVTERDARDAHVERLMWVMLNELALMPRERLELPVSDHPKIAMIAAALLADPSDRRTLGQGAEHVAVSERTLKRLMIQQTGLSFGRWRGQLHLVIALRALAGGASVQQVAGDLGYESTTAFVVMFRKALGTTPSRYFVNRHLSAVYATNVNHSIPELLAERERGQPHTPDFDRRPSPNTMLDPPRDKSRRAWTRYAMLLRYLY